MQIYFILPAFVFHSRVEKANQFMYQLISSVSSFTIFITVALTLSEYSIENLDNVKVTVLKIVKEAAELISWYVD